MIKPEEYMLYQLYFQIFIIHNPLESVVPATALLPGTIMTIFNDFLKIFNVLLFSLCSFK